MVMLFYIIEDICELTRTKRIVNGYIKKCREQETSKSREEWNGKKTMDQNGACYIINGTDHLTSEA